MYTFLPNFLRENKDAWVGILVTHHGYNGIIIPLVHITHGKVHVYSSPSSLNILISSVLNSISGRLCASIWFSSFFWRFFPVLSFGTCFFVSSFLLLLGVSFAILGKSNTSPSLGR